MNHCLVITDDVKAGLHLEESDGWLKIYFPYSEEERDFASLCILPRRLVEWMMLDPAAEVVERVDETAVSLVKSVLSARDALVQRILDAEGIVRISDLDREIHNRSVMLCLGLPMLTYFI